MNLMRKSVNFVNFWAKILKNKPSLRGDKVGETIHNISFVNFWVLSFWVLKSALKNAWLTRERERERVTLAPRHCSVFAK